MSAARNLACAFLAAAGIAQARPFQLSFRGTADVPEEGVRLALFADSRAAGLPVAEVKHWRDSAGRAYDTYSPRDLWLRRQCRGRWADARTNAIVLAAVGPALPAGLPEKDVRLEDYEAAAAKQQAVPSTVAGIGAWAEALAGAGLSGTPVVVPPPMRLAEVAAFEFAGTGPTRFGYAFRFKPNPAAVSTSQWFFALFELAGEVAIAGARQAVEKDFLPLLQPIPRQRSATAQTSAKFQDPRLAGKTQERSAEFKASREQVIASIRGRKSWWFVETPNYVLASDLPGGRAAVVKQIQHDVEYLRAAFGLAVAPAKPIESVSVIRVFSDSAEYEAYVGESFKWTGGRWDSSRKELVIRSNEDARVKNFREWLLGVVYHEAVHQYLFYALPGSEPPVWFNEGHACFFEGAAVEGNSLTVGEADRYLETVQRLASRGGADLARLVGFTYDQFYAQEEKDEEKRQENYALAWALVYYLRKGAGAERAGGAGFTNILDRCSTALRQPGTSAEEATRKAFEGVDMRKLTIAFDSFWSSVTRRSAAKRNPIFRDVKLGITPQVRE